MTTDTRGGAPTSGGPCPGCGRIMSVRELTEQGACNDCTGDTWAGSTVEGG